MDGTCITLMAFQKGIRISKATLQQSFPDKGSKKIQYQTVERESERKKYVYMHVCLSLSHTPRNYVRKQWPSPNQKKSITPYKSSKKKERENSNLGRNGREKASTCIQYNAHVRERHNKEENQEYHTQKRANIKRSSVSTESSPETRLERLPGYVSCEQQIFMVFDASSFQEHKVFKSTAWLKPLASLPTFLPYKDSLWIFNSE